MDWIKPEFSKTEVNKAGEILKKGFAFSSHWDWATERLSNWRSSHIYPLNTFNTTLRDKLRKIEPNALVAQRLKRETSIVRKLVNEPAMKLTTMQDIGGLRAIVSTLKKVEELKSDYVDNPRTKHELVKINDYIKNPKISGYRGIHLIYKYKNPTKTEYTDLRIELQIRTKIQHAWATGVETIGTFFEKSFKSSEGPKEWLDFFTLAGAAFAFLERSTKSSDTFRGSSKKEIFQKTITKADKLKVEEHIIAFTKASAKIKEDGTGMYHLIILDLSNNKKNVNIESFSKKRLNEASERYAEIEKEIASGSEKQAVLVSTAHITDLEKAYPNYFLDSKEFLRQIKRIRKKLESM